MPAELAAGQDRRVALVFDEFQEIETIDPGLPKLMRTIFEQQPEVGHVYLGSRRHMMERIFNDENEPFWRSAKKVQLDVIDPAALPAVHRQSFQGEQEGDRAGGVDRLLDRTFGHPYATQELCYFAWEQTPFDDEAGREELEQALAGVLRSSTHTSNSGGTRPPRRRSSFSCAGRRAGAAAYHEPTVRATNFPP